MSTPVGTGLRVVRGPDWKWQDQDGGDGHVGTVVEINAAGGRQTRGGAPEATVFVLWDNGTKTNYRTGHQNAYDLRAIDNAPIGIVHKGVVCSVCRGGKSETAQDASGGGGGDIVGIRWSCSTCTGEPCDLCTVCYMGDRHDASHEFWRIYLPQDSTTSGGGGAVLVGKRSTARKVALRGIFPGAMVVRGQDWNWQDQDGGPGKVGKVLAIQGWDRESGRSVANISWSSSAITNVYRVGHKGKVDLKIAPGTQAAANGHYCPDHLPVVGKANSLSVVFGAEAGRREAATSPLKQGDKVIVNVSVDSLRQLQEGHGGFNPKMLEILKRVGTVHRVTGGGDVRIQYPGSPPSDFRWTIHPSALVRVNHFVVGQIVQVLDNGDAVRKLQSGHGEWVPSMQDALGSKGRVVTVYGDGDVRVKVGENTWSFNPGCLTPLNISEPDSNAQEVPHNKSPNEELSRVVASGEVDNLKHLLDSVKLNPTSPAVSAAFSSAAQYGHSRVLQELISTFPGCVDLRHQGRTPMHVASHQGHLEALGLLLDAGASVNTPDEDGDSPLHYSAFGRRLEAMVFLLSRGADANGKNLRSCTVLHVSVVMRHVEAVKLLLNQPRIHVNVQDSYGDTPLHEAIVKDSHAVVEIFCLLEYVDFSIANCRGFNALQYAALKGNDFAVDLILDKNPCMANVAKADGYTPLHLASLNGHVEVAKLLIKKGRAYCLQVDKRYQTPLHVSVHQGQAGTTELLLIETPPEVQSELINMRDAEGDTALHITLGREGAPVVSASAETSPIVFQLIEKARQDGVGETQVHAIAIAAFLMIKGADKSIRNNRGHSANDLVTDYMAKAFLAEFVGGKKSPVERLERKTSVKAKAEESKSKSIECQVCSETVVPMRFVPCGHGIACEECSIRMKKCLQCKATIEDKVPFGTTEGETCGGGASSGESNISPCAATSGKRKETDIEEMEARLNAMEDRYTCTICMERKRSTVFPCGHSACAECAETLKLCHMCRKPIEMKINLY